MRVFVTGASGHIGSAVLPELLAAGHQVTGLARSESAAATVSAAGAAVLSGTIDDLDLLRSAAADADGVIHLAFKHEAMRSGDMLGAAAADLRGHRGDARRAGGHRQALRRHLGHAAAGDGRAGPDRHGDRRRCPAARGSTPRT